jgi:hypothetical protein
MSPNLQVFILGSARSGTSITYYAMRQVLGLPGDGESHDIPVFSRIIHSFYTYQQSFQDVQGDVLARRLDTAAFRRHILDYIRTFYASTFPEGSWVDKTPGDEAILGALLIRQAFPSAKLICTKRTGIEVVQSFRAKFSAQFGEACVAWATAMNALLSSRESCPNLLEVDQFDLSNATEEVAGEIVNYLGVPERKPALAEFFRHKRTDQLSSHDWTRRLTIADCGWTGEERALFLSTCGELMQKFGYPL